MQTFLPYPDFVQSAKCLDYKRLGKQRVEAKHILNVLLGQAHKQGWIHHPAVLMWKGYEDTLKLYHDIMIAEWINRGYNNTMQYYCGEEVAHTLLTVDYQHLGSFENPPWLTDEFSSYHRATLLYKDPVWYGQFGWTEEPKYEYLWPIMKEKIT